METLVALVKEGFAASVPGGNGGCPGGGGGGGAAGGAGGDGGGGGVGGGGGGESMHLASKTALPSWEQLTIK